jgi:hypothetical protein
MTLFRYLQPKIAMPSLFIQNVVIEETVG